MKGRDEHQQLNNNSLLACTDGARRDRTSASVLVLACLLAAASRLLKLAGNKTNSYRRE